MPVEDIRPSIDRIPLRGIGGSLRVAWRLADTPIRRESDSFDELLIQRWEIWHRYTTVKIPQSGGRGSLTKRRIADDFDFAVSIDIDLRPLNKGVGPGLQTQPFFDGRLEGHDVAEFRLAIVFQLGDPAFINHALVAENRNVIFPSVTEFPGVSYFCRDVLLEEVYILNPVIVPGVVTCIVKGSGSSPLERYVSNTITGGGAFGLLDPD